MKEKIPFSNYTGHFMKITKHKKEVCKACFMAGIPMAGITHDLSKYTPTEFKEYAMYYGYDRSPVEICKEKNGYCNSWMHHKGHNPHHYEYWVDNLDGGGVPLIMPWKYAMEMVCDYIGAGKVYSGSSYTNKSPLEYWNVKKLGSKIHPVMVKFFDAVFTSIANNGEKYALNKYRTRKMYDAIIGGYKRKGEGN